MPRPAVILLCGVVLFAITSATIANDIDAKMYKALSSPHACTRWLNEKGQVGCSTPEEGVYGIFWPLKTRSEITNFKTSKKPHSHLIPVLNGDLLVLDVVKELELIREVKGAVVITDAAPPGAYSEAPLMNHDFKFPLWSVGGPDADMISIRAHENAAKSTRYGVKMKQFMFGYKNTETCLGFQQCEPVGGHSVWGLLPRPPMPITRAQNYVMAITRLDAVSLFDGMAVGAEAGMSGLVAMMSALTVLSGHNNLEFDLHLDPATRLPDPTAVDPSKFKYPIMWALFDAEHWARAGSTRFKQDWSQFKCVRGSCTSANFLRDFETFQLNHVKKLFEVTQVGLPNPATPDELQVFGSAHGFPRFVDAGLKTHLRIPNSETALPASSSAITFDARNEHGGLYVISDRMENNPYHGSRYDTYQHLNVSLITDAATIMARALYAAAMDINPSSAEDIEFIRVNQTLVQAWFTCTTMDVNCPLARKFIPSLVDTSAQTRQTPSNYHGPFFDFAYSPIAKFTHDYMVWTSRNTSQDPTLSNCKEDSECSNAAKCVLSKCIGSSYVQFHDAYSTGIEASPKGGWRIKASDGPNWVEPYWDALSFELIYVHNSSKEAGFFVWSLFQTILFIAMIIYFKQYVKGRYEMLY